MLKINKTAILLVCTLLFTGCYKEKSLIPDVSDATLTKSKLNTF